MNIIVQLNKRFLIAVAVYGLCTSAAEAQTISSEGINGKQPLKKNILLLPDGSQLGSGGIDSLTKVWGKGRISMMHSKEDDDKGIMHLVRVTDQMAKEYAESDAKSEADLKAMIGQQAPDFSLTDLKGKKWSLNALKGKTVVLNFWFTSCPPCIQEMPQLNKLSKEYDVNKVVFLALTFDDSKHINMFLNSHSFDYMILSDSKNTDATYKIASWPTSFVIDKQGRVAFATKSSPSIYKDLHSAIEKSM